MPAMNISSPLCDVTKAMPAILLGMLFFALCGCQFPGFNLSRGTPEPGSNTNPCVVLALPNSGPYAVYAEKIRKGANLAVQDLKVSGINARLENINTEASDWLTKLNALPAECAVVGGPIQEKAYLAAKKSGMLEKRVFFSFVPTLQKGDEGIRAWRFFPSQQDQVDALTRFGVDDLNIRTYGAFYPSDSYGPRMSDLFEQNLAKRHITLRKASYNPGAPASWSRSAAQLIRPFRQGGQPLPQTDFEAIFLPDSWKNMDMLTTSLMYNGEDRLVLLGTTLWESSLTGKSVPKAAKYELAVFPAAWNKSAAPKKLQSGDNDFFVALGFDFMNFASYMGLKGRPEAIDVVSSAQKSSGKIRALAPISWDNAGVAKQRLYLFQVGANGMKPVDIEQFKRTRQATLERAALRMQGISESQTRTIEEAPMREDVPEPIVTQNTPAEVQPQAPAVIEPPLSTVPQPSYKLRLPTKR